MVAAAHMVEVVALVGVTVKLPAPISDEPDTRKMLIAVHWRKSTCTWLSQMPEFILASASDLSRSIWHAPRLRPAVQPARSQGFQPFAGFCAGPEEGGERSTGCHWRSE